MVGLETLLTCCVFTGLGVLRGVRVGLGTAVGSAVQVGSIRLRGVLLGKITLVGARVGADGVAGVAQLARINPMPTMAMLNRFKACLPFGCGSFRHFFAAHWLMGVRNKPC